MQGRHIRPRAKLGIKLTIPCLEPTREPPGGACRSRSFGALGQRALIGAPVARRARARAMHLIGVPLPGKRTHRYTAHAQGSVTTGSRVEKVRARIASA